MQGTKAKQLAALFSLLIQNTEVFAVKADTNISFKTAQIAQDLIGPLKTPVPPGSRAAASGNSVPPVGHVWVRLWL